MTRPSNQEELSKNIFDMAQEELKDLEAVQKENDKKQPEDGIESLEGYREPLSLDLSTEINIMLSWGGPSDGYKLKFDKDQQLISGVYWFADWGTYAETELTSEQAELVHEIYLYSDINSFFDK